MNDPATPFAQTRVLPRPDAVLLDWDNTLVSSWPTIHDAMNVTLERFGMTPWTAEDIRTRVRKSMRESFPELFGDDWETARDVFYKRFLEIHIERLTLLPDAERLIRTLGESRIHVGIVSNKAGDHLRAEVHHLGWDNLLDAVVGAIDAAQDKPSIEPVLMALSGSGIGPSPNVWFAGDADIDMECGHNAGATAVLIREDPPQPGEFFTAHPDAHVPDAAAFLDLIEEARGAIGK